jgi:hypothetical protein
MEAARKEMEDSAVSYKYWVAVWESIPKVRDIKFQYQYNQAHWEYKN